MFWGVLVYFRVYNFEFENAACVKEMTNIRYGLHYNTAHCFRALQLEERRKCEILQSDILERKVCPDT